MTDHRAIVEAILAGKREQFRLLVEEFQRLVSHIVFRMIPESQDREDICQEVFVKVYQNLGSFRFGSKLSTWVAQIAYNTCLTALSRKQLIIDDGFADRVEDSRPEWSASEMWRPDYRHESDDTATIVRREIDQLPPIPGTILVLFHLENMSLQQIAQVFTMPEGTIKSHLFRARKMLKERLTAKYQWEEV
ncbi:RNA polymerase subunit sigma-24 [candidate division GN15 bacterium]|uniref:RNA polymerase subunit sigma-24 n=1 Tax=candidate division GN15 bacterium TaxID=2072418 RepID=A0A855X0C1_9BACT|nr:MAG: RNA polymerase subunit sigma-24 [candidate division GN15 bacterium]